MKPLEKTRQGDVLRWPSGALRVVRLLHDHRDGGEPSLRRVFCFFAIRHCSWTGRPYTLYSLGELNGIGVRNTGVNVRFKTKFDAELVENMDNHGEPPTIRCCAVRGLP